MIIKTIIRSTVSLDPINNFAIFPANPSFMLFVLLYELLFPMEVNKPNRVYFMAILAPLYNFPSEETMKLSSADRPDKTSTLSP